MGRAARPVIIGLTGSIGMGKSTAARMLKRAGVQVFDADLAVHRLMAAKGEAVPALADAFPACLISDDTGPGIDRACLSRHIAGHPEDLKKLEDILHPLVRKAQQQARRAAAIAHAPELVLDIPLLFEPGGHRRCDLVVVVTAPAFLQRQRVMARPGMTAEKFAILLGKQLPDRQKRQQADYVIQTGIGRKPAWRQMAALLRQVRSGRVRLNPRRLCPTHPPLFVPENPDRWTPSVRAS